MNFPLILNPQALDPAKFQPSSSNINLSVIDVSSQEQFETAHLPHARHLPYSRLIRGSGNVNGLLIEKPSLQQLLLDYNISEDGWIVAYDQNGGTAASRLIWTLHAYGFYRCSLLNGGLAGWLNAHPDQSAESGASEPPGKTDVRPVQLDAAATESTVIDTSTLVQSLATSTAAPAIIDARSEAEYRGTDIRSNRGGHIPGAIHLEWKDLVEEARDWQLLPNQQLLEILQRHGLSKNTSGTEPVVVYCQTHQRSSLTYVVLKHLGFERVLGLEGAWSDWGNRSDTPVAMESFKAES